MTALPAAIVLAPALSSYPRLRGDHAWTQARVERSEPCACGRAIVQHLGADVVDVLVRHHATLAHARWREEHDL